MKCYSRVQDQLNTQQQQLGDLIKQVNALIDHRDKKETQLLRGIRGKETNAKKRAAMKNRANTQTISGTLSTELPMLEKQQRTHTKGGPQMSTIEEAKIPEGEMTQSARDRAQEQELNAINDNYKNAKEDSDLPALSKQAIKKPNSHQAERSFEPFKSPFTEEIINTSKEIHGELS